MTKSVGEKTSLQQSRAEDLSNATAEWPTSVLGRLHDNVFSKADGRGKIVEVVVES